MFRELKVRVAQSSFLILGLGLVMPQGTIRTWGWQGCGEGTAHVREEWLCGVSLQTSST